ncbi:MAG: 2-(1,2-epoxy-1,2-dihydrophenyl)acetyl-CoA isomerase [Betaproteobacteria bacterium]|nr:MAG: 2-(1,2-epoxy-1,2-dihydrophenyl)acetyl-CoA isomerase [Betaproteobacteria bacterium]
MNFETIRYEVAGAVGRITLNRPERLNALTYPMIEELHQVFRRIAAGKDGVRAVVITGAGRGFCSGADVVAPRPEDPENPKESLRDYYNPAYQLLKNLPVPTIAAVNGPCAGAGMSLALTCDIVIAVRSAYFLAAFVNIGLVPDAGSSWLLPRRIGAAKAAGMMLLGEKIPAEQAESWGLIWKCVPDDELLLEADTLAHKLATGPTKTYGFIKQLIRASDLNSLSSQMQLESELQALVRTTDDVAEARKAFAEKRPPAFKGS